MKKLLFISILSIGLLGFMGCADKSTNTEGMKSAKCGASGDGKCGAQKKSTKKCGGY